MINTSLRTDIRSVSDTVSYPITAEGGPDLDTGKRIIQSLTFLPGTAINRGPL